MGEFDEIKDALLKEMKECSSGKNMLNTQNDKKRVDFGRINALLEVYREIVEIENLIKQ